MATKGGLRRHIDCDRQTVQPNGTVPWMPTHKKGIRASTIRVILKIEKGFAL